MDRVTLSFRKVTWLAQGQGVRNWQRQAQNTDLCFAIWPRKCRWEGKRKACLTLGRAGSLNNDVTWSLFNVSVIPRTGSGTKEQELKSQIDVLLAV